MVRVEVQEVVVEEDLNRYTSLYMGGVKTAHFYFVPPFMLVLLDLNYSTTFTLEVLQISILFHSTNGYLSNTHSCILWRFNLEIN